MCLDPLHQPTLDSIEVLDSWQSWFMHLYEYVYLNQSTMAEDACHPGLRQTLHLLYQPETQNRTLQHVTAFDTKIKFEALVPACPNKT